MPRRSGFGEQFHTSIIAWNSRSTQNPGFSSLFLFEFSIYNHFWSSNHDQKVQKQTVQCYLSEIQVQCVIHYHHFGIDFEPTTTTTDKKPRTITRMNWCMLFVGYRCYTLDCHSIPLISFCPFPSFDLPCNWSESFIPLQNRKFHNVEGRFTVFGSLKIIGTYPNGSSISISSLQTLRKQLKSAQTGLIIPIL